MDKIEDVLKESRRMLAHIDKNMQLLSEVDDLIKCLNENESELSLQNFNKYEDALKKELCTNRAGALKAHALFVMYHAAMQIFEKPAAFGCACILDFIRIMMPLLSTYNNKFKQKSEWYKIVPDVFKPVGGWKVTETTIRKGFLNYDLDIVDYDYVARDRLYVTLENVTVMSISNTDTDVDYFVDPPYLKEVFSIISDIKEGRVLVLSLKSGCLATELKANLTGEITIVEKDAELIEFYKKNILSKYKNKDGITIINEDPVEYAKNNALDFDFILIDSYSDPYTEDAFTQYIEYRKAFANKENEIDFRCIGESVILGTTKVALASCAAKYAEEIIMAEEDFDGFEDEEDDENIPQAINDMFGRHIPHKDGDILSILKYNRIDKMFDEA